VVIGHGSQANFFDEIGHGFFVLLENDIRALK
jgi:hypothetical protein